MGTALQQYDPGGAYLTQWREPEDVLAEATKAAVALKRVVSMKTKPVMFNGEQYLEREDWGTVAKFYGCTAKSTETRYVQFGDIRGWEAVAVVIDRNGVEVGRAESMCLDEEETWGLVPKYEWVDKAGPDGKKIWNQSLRDGKGGYEREKQKVGETRKPLFQLRSMAQTRAEAKALKGVFSWVVVLAGYKPTPAEEMTGHEFEGQHEAEPKKEPIKEPQRASEKQQGNGAQPASGPAILEKSGIIETAKSGKENVDLWLSLKNGLIVFVPDNKIDGDMKPGMFIKFHGFENVRSNLTFWTMKGLIELSPVEDGTPAEEKELAPDAAEVAKDMFPDSAETTGKAAVQGMVDSGTLKPASQVGTAKTIGTKRAQRVYTLCSQNKTKNFGFCEVEIKKILSALPNPLDHLSDLETGMYEMFEKWATGEVDWREFWKE